MMVLLWKIWGFQLSIKKGAFGQRVDWVGLEFTATTTEVRATISAKKIATAAETAEKFLGKNYDCTFGAYSVYDVLGYPSVLEIWGKEIRAPKAGDWMGVAVG